jgi:hypothetical protein
MLWQNGGADLPRPPRQSDNPGQADSEESMPQVLPFGQFQPDADICPSSAVPLYESVLDWVTTKLGSVGCPRPLCKRLAVLICGLLSSEKATVGDLSTAVEALTLSPAKGESIARRLQRMLQDTRLDPVQLPRLLQPLLPELLRSQRLAHAANAGSAAGHHARFVGIVIILDESSQADAVHLLVAGVPLGGVIIPLAIRTWTQNVPLPEGEYWTQVLGLLQDIHAVLPPELRDHVLLVADRAYGVPRMLDVLMVLGWHWLLRVQGQTRVCLRDGTICPLRQLVPQPGTQWSSGFSSTGAPETEEEVGVFKTVGWRRSQVVAVWTLGEAEPWLLLTSLSAQLVRVAEYAQRWAIERLFLSWKSHGWALEVSGVREAPRLGRLLTGIALATLWRLAMALPTAWRHLADLEARAGRGVRQLRLPGFEADPRPWPAKFSLMTWGAKTARSTWLRTHTPSLCWHLPDWEGRTWEDMCRDACLAAHRQFSISP